MILLKNLSNMRELVRAVSEKLEIDRNEAELVIATLLSRPRFALYMSDTIEEQEMAALWSKIGELKKGVPIEYVTGRVQFRDLTLFIQPGVFIPRLETEYFVELIPAMVRRRPKRILEIGTGCGAIAIALARVYPEARIIATDISAAAIESAHQNILKMQLQEQISLVQSNKYDGMHGDFDLVISNPPYVPSERMPQLPRSVRDFEPLAAIDGGKQGVQFIKELILESGMQSVGAAVMALEIDEESVKVLTEFLDKNDCRSFKFCRDLFNRYRYLFVGDINEKSKDHR
jgi:release factor glutamine methyltransferase